MSDEVRSFAERVAARAVEVDLGRLLLTLLAVPFWLIGVVIGVAWVALRWMVAAVAVGVADVRDRRVRTDAG